MRSIHHGHPQRPNDYGAPENKKRQRDDIVVNLWIMKKNDFVAHELLNTGQNEKNKGRTIE
jgi:hypothetical protein